MISFTFKWNQSIKIINFFLIFLIGIYVHIMLVIWSYQITDMSFNLQPSVFKVKKDKFKWNNVVNKDKVTD